MTGRERLLWLVLIAVLLLAGTFLGRLLRPSPNPGNVADASDLSVRTWLWEWRTVDLTAQVGLIFAGALGVAAILPYISEGVEALTSHAEDERGPS